MWTRQTPPPVCRGLYAVRWEGGRTPPEQAQPRQLAEEQAALRRVATLVQRVPTPPQVLFAAVLEEARAAAQSSMSAAHLTGRVKAPRRDGGGGRFGRGSPASP